MSCILHMQWGGFVQMLILSRGLHHVALYDCSRCCCLCCFLVMAFDDTYVERGRTGSIVGRSVCYEVIAVCMMLWLVRYVRYFTYQGVLTLVGLRSILQCTYLHTYLGCRYVGNSKYLTLYVGRRMYSLK